MAEFQYDPIIGFNDVAAFPNPTTKLEGRAQVQSLLDQIRDAHNTLANTLKSVAEGESGADNIGSPIIPGVDGVSVFDQLYSLKLIIDNLVVGIFPPGTIVQVVDNITGTKYIQRIENGTMFLEEV